MPIDVAVKMDGTRKEMDLHRLRPEMLVLDIGKKTIDRYSRFIKGAGTVFMSGPPGAFEYEEFALGTEMLLKALSDSFATTIVSGGHLSAALHRFGIHDSIDHVSTSGRGTRTVPRREAIALSTPSRERPSSGVSNDQSRDKRLRHHRQAGGRRGPPAGGHAAGRSHQDQARLPG